ncbi:MAG TPA: choice-of-anchor tandem repeat GloVer-containing protein [Candidatus Binatia bacterium]|nr:choice-of-anchor tandem repeat GloVer-containing protein [Candidatus Binatia bacterium]
MRIGTLFILAAVLAGCSSAAGTQAVPGSSAGTEPAASRAFGREAPLYSFEGRASGGAPMSGLLLHNGLLYGTTSAYGKGYGTVFDIDAFGKLHVLYAFTGYPDAQYPQAGLVFFNGAFYGTSSAGGVYAGGTIFSVSPDGAEHVVHSFGNRRDGALPLAGLLDVNGVLYGTTQDGGNSTKGTVFELDASGERVLHSFAGAPADGGHPTAGLIRYKDTLFGTTRAGGQLAAGGTVYRISPFGQERVLHSFGVNHGDGMNPAGPLVVVNGEFYGTTLRGGDRISAGTVFAMSPSGSEQVLHSFDAGADGSSPLAGLVLVGGELYGTTMNGGLTERRSGDCLSGPDSTGSPTCGTIFKIDAFGREQVVYRFRGYSDGANPEAGLTNISGTLYGTTTWGGQHVDFGTVFRLLP